MRTCLLAAVGLLFIAGCVGSPVHATFAHRTVKMTTKRNNKALLNLQIGMSRDEVLERMGEPERSEGYPWGAAWLYRTAITTGIEGSVYGAADADYTPLIFDEAGVLQGWGRNYFKEFTRKYEIDISHK